MFFPYVAGRAMLCAIVLAMLPGCAGVIRPVRDAISPPGEMNDNGKINPCHGYKADAQTCGDAKYNAEHIGQVALGQTVEQVRQIMGREPEQHSVQVQGAQSLETWSFRTDYKNRVTTHIDFADSKVVAIRQVRL